MCSPSTLQLLLEKELVFSFLSGKDEAQPDSSPEPGADAALPTYSLPSCCSPCPERVFLSHAGAPDSGCGGHPGTESCHAKWLTAAQTPLTDGAPRGPGRLPSALTESAFWGPFVNAGFSAAGKGSVEEKNEPSRENEKCMVT